MSDIFHGLPSLRTVRSAAATAASLVLLAGAPAPQRVEAASSNADASAAAPEPKVPVVRVKQQTLEESLEITANAAAVNQVKLIARVGGYLERIHFEDGALVRKGDLLFTIQQDQYRAQLQQAQSQLLAQQAALSYAKTEVGRYTQLLARKAASQVDVDHWSYERQSAEAAILGAQAQVALAQLNLSYTEVRAPFDGQMGRHLVDPGNVVGGSGQPTELAEITQLDPIYVVANLSSQQALQIRANLDRRPLPLEELRRIPVRAGLSNETGFPHAGTLDFVAPAIDAATGTLAIRALLPNSDRGLLPGVFVRLSIPTGRSLKNAILVPQRALQEDQSGNYLLIVDAGDVVQRRNVELGDSRGSLQIITSGLSPDDRVIVGELWRATPGGRVSPQLTSIGD